MKKRPSKLDKEAILFAYSNGFSDFINGRKERFPDNVMLSNSYASGWADAALGEYPTDEEIVDSIWNAESGMN